MLAPSSAGAVLTSAAASSDSGSASGAISILVGVAIIIAAFRWAYVSRRASRSTTEDTPAPPVRRLGADVDWWRENAGTGAPSAADDDGPGTVIAPTTPVPADARPDPTSPGATVPEPGQSSTN
ncbi:hypothetical protein ABIB25_001888 [Nakamurella sp. UYEF19]|uniref:hypothetical protein n=1 Tax=Nakamurella sp. UYEF19 TaxID=1756392 RepID=UPI003394C5F5